jgi:hypothetical protein
MRDVIFHTQWCAAVGMVAVQWPQFVCEYYCVFVSDYKADLRRQIRFFLRSDGRLCHIVRRSPRVVALELTRVFFWHPDITIAQPSTRHWDPLSVPVYTPPTNFADQLADQSSPLFIDTSAPNLLYTLPANASDGLASWAYTIGLYPQDLFGVCIILFLGIIAGTIALSVVLWAFDTLAGFIGRMLAQERPSGGGFLRSPRYSSTSKEVLDAASAGPAALEQNPSASGNFLLRKTARFMPTPARSHWSKLVPDFYGSFHFSVLHGNLVRVLILFHLPVTIFSTYQMTMGRGNATLASVVLAAISFAVFSIVIPALLIARISRTPTNKLYDETRTLLAIGPLYNHYRQGSQFFASVFFLTNLAFGITVGCGQRSGTAQAIIILVIEVVSALFTSIWLPWGHGASMGLISFLFCVARIVVAVLLVTLTPTVSWLSSHYATVNLADAVY